jgi:hypothetical protein
LPASALLEAAEAAAVMCELQAFGEIASQFATTGGSWLSDVLLRIFHLLQHKMLNYWTITA